jgi:hypothetical protein
LRTHSEEREAGRGIEFHSLLDGDPPAGDWRDEVYKDYAALIIVQPTPDLEA